MVFGPQSSGDDRQPRHRLSADDFHRLGVRPYEVRQTVIRQAATKTSKTLARRQLASPSAKTEVQLSQVAVSTYRLLDPRNRGSETQRAHVGRILPNALRWAGRTSFSSGQESGEQDTDVTESDVQINRVSLLKLDNDEPSPMVLETGLDLDVPWSQSLDESDLLRRRWVSIRWFRRQLHQPVVLLALIAVLTGASVWVWRLNGIQDRFAARVEASTTEVDQQEQKTLLPTSTEVPVSEQVAVITDGPASEMILEPDKVAELAVSPNVPEDQTDSPTDTESIQADNGSRLQLSDTFAGSGMKENDRIADPPESSTADNVAIQIVDVDEAMMPRSATDVDLEIELLLEHLLTLSEFDSPSETSSSEMETMPDAVPADVPQSSRLAVPDQRLISESRRQFEALVPALARQRSLKTADLISSALSEIQQAVEDGTVDQWTIALAMAECEWLIGDLSGAERRLQPITVTFDIGIDELLAATFLEMPSPVNSADVHLSLLENGLMLADRLLVNESHADCRRVLASLSDSAGFLNDADVSSRLDDFREAALTTTRLQETVAQTSQRSPADVSSSQAGITGRYFCLMLRQWDTGLPWLAKGSDPRLSSLAKDDLAITAKDDAPADELNSRLDVAKRWLQAADRNDGREADSMRLHAVEVLRLVDLSTRGFRQLEAQRLIDETFEALPSYLRNRKLEAQSDANQDMTSSSPVAESKTEGDQQDQDPGYLNGRILVDENDLGIRLEYRPSMAISSDALEQIAAKLNRDVFKWAIQLSGTFDTRSPGKVRLHVGESTDGMTQEVYIDDQLIAVEAETSIAVVPVATGVHTIRWEVAATRINKLFLAVQDVETGRSVTVQPVDLPAADENSAELTIKIQ